MKRANRRQLDKGGIELIEEATHLMRLAPASAWASYYLGTLPFILGLLYFWADMSRNAFAGQRLTGEAFGLALLFVWMKCWQTVFARRLRAQVSREPEPRWTTRRWLRVLLVQSTLQPFGLFLLPLALIVMLPFGWLYAFYGNATVLGDGQSSDVKTVLKKSWKQSQLWPMQNHVMLLILLLFALFVLLNWISVCFLLPQLLKMFFGIESIFTQSQMSFLNTTFFAAMFGLTYLSVDPLLKAAYVLRCFYGESLHSGEDLKAELKIFVAADARRRAHPETEQPPPSKVGGYKTQAASIITLLLLACSASLNAAESPEAGNLPSLNAPLQPATISGPQLDQAINQIINQPRYAWRLPRETLVKPESQKGAIARFFERVANTLKDWARTVRDWVEKLVKWIFQNEPKPASKSWLGLNWITSLQGLLFMMITLVVSALAIFLYRVWRQRQRKDAAILSETIVPTPDLTDENVGADQLPEDGWIKLGRELLGLGELRLAIRAFYLASLAHLAGRSLITLAKFKSNRDYEMELRRRGHALPDLVPLFGENVSVFDRIWYGLHEVNQELVNHFVANVERIKAV